MSNRRKTLNLLRSFSLTSYCRTRLPLPTTHLQRAATRKPHLPERVDSKTRSREPGSAGTVSHGLIIPTQLNPSLPIREVKILVKVFTTTSSLHHTIAPVSSIFQLATGGILDRIKLLLHILLPLLIIIM